MLKRQEIRPFRGHDAYRITQFLAEGIGSRVTGSEQERAAGAYIADTFRGMGYQVSIQEFVTPAGAQSWNIKATWSSPLHEPYLTVGAHYDSVDGTPGANDNASGIGMLIETAIVLAALDLPIPAMFVAFGAEEGSHAGSLHFVSTLDSRGSVAGMINLDAVGVEADLEIGCYGDVDPWLADHCRATAESLGFAIGACNFGGKSDYASFADAGIPVACFARTDQPTAHTPDDNMSLISREGMAEIGSILVDALVTLTPRRHGEHGGSNQ